VIGHPEYQPTPLELSKLNLAIAQCSQGMPLPYILGEWSFFGRSFIVTPQVLIPRPDTELLVERAIQHAGAFQNPNIVDIGTGSGVIAISLACELTNAKVTAVDLSLVALKVARKNALKHQQNRINFVQSNLIQPFKEQFDLICANLPYIPSRILESLEVRKREPRLALDGGRDGLRIIRSLLEQAKHRLSTPGVILLEIESSTGELALKTAQKSFPNAETHLLQDLAGNNRLVEIIQS
jgi:release factor glutamine methyltransferase